MDYALYIASAVGAVALFLMMPRAGYTPTKIGGLVGAIALGGLWITLARLLPDELGLSSSALPYYFVFSALAIAAAVRVITHTKPVYSALWFIMVVLATSGLFLILGAEFMAMAMLIIYGGAILVTYVFVIMLAASADSPDEVGASGEGPEYDRVAREPFGAVAAGFVLLAVLLTVIFQPISPNPDAMARSDQYLIDTTLTNRTAARLVEKSGDAPLPENVVNVHRLDNAERVGLDLFKSHPLGLELAGVILLVSLVGAVVIARKRVEEQTQNV